MPTSIFGAPSRRTVLGAGLAGLGAAMLPGSARAGAPMNVIVVLNDALRADHINTYGYKKRVITPNIDRFAARSVLFEQVISQAGWTIPSVASLYTGMDPQAHKVLREKKEGATVEMDTMSLEFDTMAELFQRAGYRTAGVIKSPVLHTSAGYDQGFDEFAVVPGPDAHHDSAQQLTDAAIAKLHELQAAGKPFFLYIHYMDVHAPYIPPDPWYNKYKGTYAGPLTGKYVELDPYVKGTMKATPEDLEYLKGLYDAELEYLDIHWGRFMENLVSSGADANTMVAWTGDHGEAFGEHGQFFHGNLYQENIRVPLIFKVPGVAPRRVSGGWVEMTDTPATLAELCGLSKPARWTSISQAAAIRGGAAVIRPVYCEYMNGRTIIEPSTQLKYIYDTSNGRSELFDLSKDPDEKTNLASSRAADIARLKDLAEKRVAVAKGQTASIAPTAAKALDAQQTDALKALGYVE